jgi:hypothetical protein
MKPMPIQKVMLLDDNAIILGTTAHQGRMAGVTVNTDSQRDRLAQRSTKLEWKRVPHVANIDRF